MTFGLPLTGSNIDLEPKLKGLNTTLALGLSTVYRILKIGIRFRSPRAFSDSYRFLKGLTHLSIRFELS